MFDVNDTLSLIAAVEQIKPPSSYLADTFFPNVVTSTLDTVLMEYRSRGREKLAPYVVEGTRGVNIARKGSQFRLYSPPMVAPRRVLSSVDVTRRQFGETPVFSTTSAEERQAKIIADDMVDLLTMIQNRKNQQAAELLTTGKITIEGYADDGVITRLDEVSFDWAGPWTIATDWDQPSAKIFSDLEDMSEYIQEYAGQVPSLLVVGKNVPRYLLSNKEVKDWLMIPRRENLTMFTLAPHYVSPLVRYIGRIDALNLDIVSYCETYTADDGKLKPYLGADDVILAIPGRGKCMHAAIVMVDDNETGFHTYATPVVPSYDINKYANTMAVTMRSKFIMVPEVSVDWVYAKVKA